MSQTVSPPSVAPVSLESAALARAIDACGGKLKFARLLKQPFKKIETWTKVPLRLVEQVETISGVGRHELRPDAHAPSGEQGGLPRGTIIGNCELYTGDCRAVLARLPPDSHQCCVTSPPYFNLRNYDVAGQIGLESSLDLYIETLVAVLRLVRRVLRKDGTCWVNIGDSYAGGGNGGGGGFAKSGLREPEPGTDRNKAGLTGSRGVGGGLKAKDLMLVPHRLAIALQQDGWWVRSDIIWHKTNAMPESCQDRPSYAHEHVLLLTRSRRYFYNYAAVREPAVKGAAGSSFTAGLTDIHQKGRAGQGARIEDGMRNLSDVWALGTQASPLKHFAMMPPALAELCLKAGTRPGDVVLDPFGGVGTTGLVAERMGRRSTLIELNPAYANAAARRLYDDAPLLAAIADCA